MKHVLQLNKKFITTHLTWKTLLI